MIWFRKEDLPALKRPTTATFTTPAASTAARQARSWGSRECRPNAEEMESTRSRIAAGVSAGWRQRMGFG